MRRPVPIQRCRPRRLDALAGYNLQRLGADLGGAQVQIGGPAGAFIVIVYGIVERYGLANLLIATSLSGLLLVMGWLKLGVLVRYIPVSIMIGFTNGIAVRIGLSQRKDLMGLRTDKMPGDFFSQIAALVRAPAWHRRRAGHRAGDRAAGTACAAGGAGRHLVVRGLEHGRVA